jgi:hypothetical protein
MLSDKTGMKKFIFFGKKVLQNSVQPKVGAIALVIGDSFQ